MVQLYEILSYFILYDIWASCWMSGHLGILFVWASGHLVYLGISLGILFIWASCFKIFEKFSKYNFKIFWKFWNFEKLKIFKFFKNFFQNFVIFKTLLESVFPHVWAKLVSAFGLNFWNTFKAYIFISRKLQKNTWNFDDSKAISIWSKFHKKVDFFDQIEMALESSKFHVFFCSLRDMKI